MPSLIVIAGPNGSGKSTMFNALIEKVPSFKNIPFINPDEVAKEIHGSYIIGSTSHDNSLMLRAGKEAVRRRKALLESKKSFGFETTLSGNSEINLIKEARALGYSINIVFIGLVNPNLNIMRVLMRVAAGGHYVDSEMVIRRYQRSLDNAIKILPFVKRFYIFDNSKMKIQMIASSKTTEYKSKIVRSVHVYQNTENKWYQDITLHLKQRNNKDANVEYKETILYDADEYDISPKLF